ncbi:MAG: saccharopine dehydrogenase C-terminal domain-containing protein [Bacteroidota bacterium]|nr:saccharopine dehydrogenase C-terminal domain-containing protein [Bacteroidota bacterium]
MDAQKVILVLGAGRSSSSLIAHLLGQSEGEGWEIHVGDLDLAAAQSKVQGHPNGRAFQMSSSDATDRDARIASADLVISMLPAFMHPEVASVAIEAGVHVLTPSYVSEDMQALDARAKEKGVLVLNEMGLDPGIDHMSAMQVIDEIREVGGTMVSFASYCGGLVAPASDDNPWHYKLSWNPRNVVLAGQGGAATFLDRGRVRVVPPHKAFQALTPVEVGGRRYDGYPNRDSLGYQELYGLQGIQSLVRGTLRGEGYCQAWDVLVQLGMVRDDVRLMWPAGTTWASWTRTFLPAHLDAVTDVHEAVARATGAADEALDKMAWLGLFDDHKGPEGLEGTPAQIVEALVTVKWVLGADDRDMIVMWHKFEYDLYGERKAKTSSLSLEGKDSTFTAMSDTVGLPMALAVKPMLEGAFGTTGVDVPMSRTYYEPLLAGLAELGIVFEEREIEA